MLLDYALSRIIVRMWSDKVVFLSPQPGLFAQYVQGGLIILAHNYCYLLRRKFLVVPSVIKFSFAFFPRPLKGGGSSENIGKCG